MIITLLLALILIILIINCFRQNEFFSNTVFNQRFLDDQYIKNKLIN